MLTIVNTGILTDGACIPDAFLRITEGKISETGTMKQLKGCPGENVLDAQGAYICPGFIDIHNHGALGADAMDATSDAFETISRWHLSHGVTSFLLTTMTDSLDSIQQVFDCLEKYRSRLPVRILGIHMEGPFLTKKNAGAQPEEYLRRADDESLRFLEKNKQLLKLVTVSPDASDIERVIAFCKKEGITVSAGHDDAVDTEIYRAVRAGVTSVTHLYCCSSGIRRKGGAQKRLGLTQIGLMEPDLYCEVIADGCHIPDLLFPLIYRCKGYERICLVSDAIRAAGLPKGFYMLGREVGGTPIEVTDTVAMLKGENLFAGSITPVSRMVEHLVTALKIPLEEAVSMAGANQARLLGIPGKGAVRAGYDAELNLLDQEGRLLKTVIGEQVFTSVCEKG